MDELPADDNDLTVFELALVVGFLVLFMVSSYMGQTATAVTKRMRKG